MPGARQQLSTLTSVCLLDKIRLRHVSLILAERGVPINDVQLYMGLTNLSTLSKYVRIACPSEQGAAAERAAQRLGLALASTGGAVLTRELTQHSFRKGGAHRFKNDGLS